MAKGDQKKVQQQTTQTRDLGNQQTNDLINNTILPKTQETQELSKTANTGAVNDYNNLMGDYKSMPTVQGPSPYIPITSNPVTAQTANYSRTPEFNEGLGNYRNFAQTGGLSGEDQNNIRERGISPIRSVYENTQNNINRQRSLAGGYSPNYNAVSSKLAREGSQQIADRTQDVNGQIAQMVQQGKMFGTQGFGNMSQRDLELATQTALQNAQQGNAVGMFNEGNRTNIEGMNREGVARGNDQNINAFNANLNKTNSMANLYSATPGLANTFANQFQNNVGDLLNAQGLRNGINQNAVNNQLNTAQIPSNFDTALGRVGSIANIGGKIAAPFIGGGGGLMTANGSGVPFLPSSNPFLNLGTTANAPNISGNMPVR